jgi:hypothetical protein
MVFSLSFFVSLVVAICFMSSSLKAMNKKDDDSQKSNQSNSNITVRQSNSSSSQEVDASSFSSLTSSDFVESFYSSISSSSGSLVSSFSSSSLDSSSTRTYSSPSSSSSSFASSSTPSLVRGVGTLFSVWEGKNNSTTHSTSSSSTSNTTQTQTQTVIPQQELLTEFNVKIQHHYGRLAELQKAATPLLQEAELLISPQEYELAKRYQKLQRRLARYKKEIDNAAMKALKLNCSGKPIGKEKYEKLCSKASELENGISSAIGQLRRELLRNDIKSTSASTSSKKGNSKDKA